jgi:hypothetical protein
MACAGTGVSVLYGDNLPAARRLEFTGHPPTIMYAANG